MRPGLIASLLMAAPWPAAAQELAFQHLTTDDGLSDNAITCVYEGTAGLIWIGTESGLDRYDGTTVRPVAGARMHISAITEDRQGTLWIATAKDGLLRYDTKQLAVLAFQHDELDTRTIATDQLTSLYDLNDTTLLIGAREASLIFMDKRTHRFSYWTDSLSLSPAHASMQPMIRKGWCHALIPLDEDRLWIGFLHNYTSLLVDRTTLSVEHALRVQRTGSETLSCAVLSNGIFYAGGWQNNIDTFPLRAIGKDVHYTLSPSTISIPDETLALARWSNGRILAGTRQSGLYVIDTATGSTTRILRSRTDPSSLPNDRIRCLLADRNGTLWVGTANGLARHVPSVWRMHVRGLFDGEAEQPDVFVHRLDALPDGSMRAFTSIGLIDVPTTLGTIRLKRVDHNSVPLQPTVSGVDHTGNLLLGTEYGILRYRSLEKEPIGALEPTSGNGHYYRLGTMYQVRGIWPDTVQGRPVYVIGTLGFSTHVVDAASGRILGYCVPKAAATLTDRSLVYSIVRDDRGNYWSATANGIFSWHPRDPVEPLAAAPNGPIDNTAILAPGADVRQMHLQGDTLWAVTHGGSLLRIVDRSVHEFVPPAWLQSTMHGLTLDRQANIWITTDDGLLRFDPRAASFIRVPVNDGRTFRKLTRAITTLTDGRIALCADNHAIVFDPTAYNVLPTMPLPYVTSVSRAGLVLPVRIGRVELSYRASVIDIGISALGHGSPQSLVFEYRLRDVETEWRTTAPNLVIAYAGVPVGEHALLVRVRDAYGRIGGTHAVLMINVSGPIWQQWWFYALLALGISGGVFLWSRYRMKQALKLHDVRNKIASDLHDEVGSSLSSITIGSQLATQLSSNENEQVKQLMARIGETSSESLRSMSDIVWAIDPKNDEGEALVKRMRRIANELLESKGVTVEMNVTGGVEELKLPMNARKDLLLIFKEAAHNASKYADARRVTIDLTRANGTLSLSVMDDGKGFDPVLHPDGHGLGSMQRRARSLGTTLALKSATGSGTLVSIEVNLTRIRD